LDWTVVEKLAPSLAWPLVAVVALPFVIWRFNALVTAIREAKLLSERIPELTEIVRSFDAIKSNIDQVKLGLVDVRVQLNHMEVENQIERSDIGELSEAISEVVAPPEQDVPPAPEISVDDMYDEIATAWDTLLDALDAAYLRGGLDAPDKRAVGFAARTLADRRRRSPISSEDVDLIANLHGLFKRFSRMKATKEDWLTSEIHANFLSGVKKAAERLSAFGT
jgi:hypothetical protein